MSNKIETSYSGMFLDTKLKVLLDDLNTNLIEGRFSTKEDISLLFNKTIKEYSKTLDKSLLEYKMIASGSEPDIVKFNSDLLTIYNDLKILYLSLRNLRNLLTSNFNTLSGMTLKLKSDIAETSSNLIDYKIQNTTKFSPAFSDSFYNLSKIESDAKAYGKEKAFVDLFNNNIVLPLNKEATSAKIKKISIAGDSVGTSGNNQEIGSIARDNLKLAVDGSIDTWFEFEQVGVTELGSPTTLNLKLEFQEEIFFNLLDVATVQMPNGSYPVISEIKGSQDGSIFFDLTSLYLGSWDHDSLGNKIIPLSENPENPNGSNLLYFLPRKVKFLVIKLIEDSSYFIRTSSGVKYRRAIGIKEIKPKSQKFKNSGQFITTNFLSNKEISKISLFTDEFSPSNFKSTFEYFISVDNGQNWDPISPSQKVKDKIPEILNYNIDYLQDSKKTDFPVASIKLKCDFKVEPSDDATSITSSYTTKKQTEFKTVAEGVKSIQLDRIPFGSIQMYRTNYGSVGKESYYKIPNFNLKELEDRYLLQLPISVYPIQSIQQDQEELFIDNYIWTRVEEINEEHESLMVYEFDYLNNIVTFNKAKNDNRYGKLPVGDIFFKLKRENVFLKKQADYTLIETNLPHDAIKENISIYSVDEESSTLNFKLRNLASVHRLGVPEIESIEVIIDANSILNNEKNFTNGVVELTSPGDYSIDKKRGIVYTHSSLSATEDVKIKAYYKKKNQINFDIVDGEIRTTENLKKQNKSFAFDIAIPRYAIDLGFKNIEEKSIIFIEFPVEIKKEVPYEEMENEFNKTETADKYSIDYKNGIVYFQVKVDGKISGTLVNSNYFGEYNVTYKIPEYDYTVFPAERRVDFSDKFVSDYFNFVNTDYSSASLMKVEYSYTEEVKESLGDLFPYVTPFIKEYKIITTPKELL